MTEQRIFEILLEKNKDKNYAFDYPTLQKGAVKCIAKNLTDIIYDTLKQKSSASGVKRGNVLKFINNLCEAKESHLHEENLKPYLKAVQNSIKVEDENETKLFCEIKSDLEQHLPKTFSDKVLDFYKKKHFKQKARIKKLEFIKMKDQDKMNAKYNMQVRKNFSYYETNENLIRDLLPDSPYTDISIKDLSLQTECPNYRDKQIKLLYALLNLKNRDISLIQRILQRLQRYSSLIECETNFIQYLWISSDINNVVTTEFLAEKFPFLLERIILKYSTELLAIEEANNVEEFFFKLESDKNCLRLKEACRNNPVICYRIRNLINELYCHSYCNSNILKLYSNIM